MTIDELDLVRQLGEVDPLPAEASERAEVLLRAAMAVPEISGRTIGSRHVDRLTSDRPRRRSVRVLSAVAASALALAGAGIGWAVAGNPSHTHPKSGDAGPTAILTAAEVHLITARSITAASSGTAEVTQTSTLDGAPQEGFDTAVTFSGQNIDEKITVFPNSPGSANSFTTDDRFVDGQFYMYTPGPGDVLEWLHDIDSANDASSMQFPDPRTLYAAISPQARFTADGTTTMNGETVTRLVAGDPSAISTAALANLTAAGTLSAFAIWVDPNDVVQQIALSTTATSCSFTGDSGGLSAYQPGKVTSVRNDVGKSLPCTPEVTNSSVTVAFADLGMPQSVTAPEGAVNFLGKG